MARKDLPYLPLYIQDFLTDEQLMECSASATGVYIRIMCVLHKCSPYGKLLLRQKDQQTGRQVLDFANKLAKFLPFDKDVILAGITELLDEGCLKIEGNFLFQKRMVNDGELSLKRSESGRLGAEESNKNRQNFAEAKNSANADIEIEIEYDNENVLKDRGGGEGKWNTKPGVEELGLDLDPVKGGAVIQMFAISKNQTLTEKDLAGLWEIFKKQNFTGESYYQSKNKVYSHFINWSKNQKIKNIINGKQGTSSVGRTIEFDKP